VVLTGGPYITTCPGSGRLHEPNHKPHAEDNNTNIPTVSKKGKLNKISLEGIPVHKVNFK
jgi:hypothetical protein